MINHIFICFCFSRVSSRSDRRSGFGKNIPDLFTANDDEEMAYTTPPRRRLEQERRPPALDRPFPTLPVAGVKSGVKSIPESRDSFIAWLSTRSMISNPRKARPQMAEEDIDDIESRLPPAPTESRGTKKQKVQASTAAAAAVAEEEEYKEEEEEDNDDLELEVLDILAVAAPSQRADISSNPIVVTTDKHVSDLSMGVQKISLVE